MRKPISFVLIIFIILSVFALPAMASGGFPDMKDHWAASSVMILAEKNIVAGWDGLFHPNDRVKANEYIKMVVTALGYTDIQNYPGDWAKNFIEKAIELGLVLAGEIPNYSEPINRGMMAKIAMRALNDEQVPNYIMAYKGLLTDYNDLDASIRMDALKCVEKGIIKGMPDGAFKPSYFSTRAEAATVIHRMLSQEEREKAKPVFATPDSEFEAFMASPEAENVCSVENILKVVDGKVIFGSPYSGYQVITGDRLVYAYHNTEANKEVYEVLSDLVMYARQNGHFVRTFLSSDNDSVFVMYYEEPKYGQGPNWYTTANFQLIMSLEPFKYTPEQEQETFYTIKIRNLFMQTTEDKAAVNYREPEMTKALEIAIKSIYGDDLGQKILNLAIQEYDIERDHWFRQGDRYYKKYSLEYRDDIGGLEILYDDGIIGTNK